MIDVMADAAPVGDLGQLRQMIRSMLDLEEQIAQAEALLTSMREAHQRLQCEHIPDLMMTHQVTRVDLDGGHLDLVDHISASIPAPSTIEGAKPEAQEALSTRRQAALQWLRDNGYGALIKNIITITVPKGDDALATKIMALVHATFKLEPSRSDSVHPSTLKSWVKEHLQLGTDLPFDLLSISAGKRAIFKFTK